MRMQDIVNIRTYNDDELKGCQLCLFNFICIGFELGEDSTNSYIHFIMSVSRASIAVQFMFDWKRIASNVIQ